MIEFLQNNYEWIFSGLGSSIVFWFVGYKQGYNKAVNQDMKVGNGSTAVQVGGDMKGNVGGKN
ncbi:hypothetical protein [Salinivibrio proteolyticus]|uniref:Bacteriocin n=1 Tax=Salinivibrio proteolyticus TaxID=334715 RepID=A0ABY7LG18_9GAMM|nr:hypothetical protein [Salinivibrio proteolyticus]WBA15127.1 hypothetical protein N7E60_02095 [Salinivibrio proteolyticus]